MSRFLAASRRITPLLVLASTASAATPTRLAWGSLAPLPDREGLAGMYAGVAGGVIIAAGGTQFADGIPNWEGGTKLWSDSIYVLDPSSNAWRISTEKLPRKIGDGVAFGYRDELICIGGGDAAKAYTDVFALRLLGSRIEVSSLPTLPSPCLKMAGVRVGARIYICGGRDDPSSLRSLHNFWVLDLARPDAERKWHVLPPWPGASRMMPIVAAAGDSVYLFGGIEVAPDSQGKPVNRAPYLSDAYRFTPTRDSGGRWDRLADLPRPLACSPSPAYSTADAITIFGGIDGAIEAIPVAKRGSIKSLPGDIYRYDLEGKRWLRIGAMPDETIRVNAPAFEWQHRYVIVGGEHLPSRRTNATTVVNVEPQ